MRSIPCLRILVASLTIAAGLQLSMLEVAAQSKLLFQAVCVTPTNGEYVSIYNPGATSVDLSKYYIYDAYHQSSNTSYIFLPNPRAGTVGGGTFFDFNAKFPAGSRVAPHDTVAVALHGAATFAAQYGRPPAFELAFPGGNDPLVPDMIAALPGAVPGTADSVALTNFGESIVLYYWDGSSDLVIDADYVFWGFSGGSYVVNKTGRSVDGPDGDAVPTTYLPDTPAAQQSPVSPAGHSPGLMLRREDFSEGAQHSGGNGVGGRDETSEDLQATWSSDKPAAPPFVKPGGVIPAVPTTWSAIKGRSR